MEEGGRDWPEEAQRTFLQNQEKAAASAKNVTATPAKTMSPTMGARSASKTGEFMPTA